MSLKSCLAVDLDPLGSGRNHLMAHESGHVVAAIVYGIPIIRVTIDGRLTLVIDEWRALHHLFGRELVQQTRSCNREFT